MSIVEEHRTPDGLYRFIVHVTTGSDHEKWLKVGRLSGLRAALFGLRTNFQARFFAARIPPLCAESCPCQGPADILFLENVIT